MFVNVLVFFLYLEIYGIILITIGLMTLYHKSYTPMILQHILCVAVLLIVPVYKKKNQHMPYLVDIADLMLQTIFYTIQITVVTVP